MIKLLLVDDDKLILEGIKGLLQNHGDFEVTGCADSGEQALAFLQNNPVDVVLLDLNMPGLGGMETTKKIHLKYPKVRIIILTINKSQSFPRQLIKTGASAYLTKGCDVEELVLAIKRVYSGRQYIAQELSQQIALQGLTEHIDNPFDKLSNRELQIIDMMLRGIKSIQIGEQLNLSPKTIATHKSRAYDKLNTETDMELFLLAKQFNII